jgi:hypothetical protein
VLVAVTSEENVATATITSCDIQLHPGRAGAALMPRFEALPVVLTVPSVLSTWMYTFCP